MSPSFLDIIHPGSASDSLLPSDWERFIPLIKFHHLDGWFFVAHGESLPKNVIHSIKAKSLEVYKRNLLYLEILTDLKADFQKFGIDFTVLKGLALLGRFYSNPAQRAISDIDLLISSHSVLETDRILKASGFETIEEKKWVANDFKWLYTKRVSGFEIALEIHTKLFNSEPKDFKWRKEPNLKNGFSVLQREDFLIHLCGHLVDQHCFAHLFWLLDIDLFLRKEGNLINAELLYSRAISLKKLKSVQAAFQACSLAFQTPLQKLGNLKNELDSFSLWKVTLTKTFLETGYKRSCHYYLNKHLFKDSIMQAILYDWHWFKAHLW